MTPPTPTPGGDVVERLVRFETKLDALLSRVDDHEDRLRAIERAQWRTAGAAGVLAAVASTALRYILPA